MCPFTFLWRSKTQTHGSCSDKSIYQINFCIPWTASCKVVLQSKINLLNLDLNPYTGTTKLSHRELISTQFIPQCVQQFSSFFLFFVTGKIYRPPVSHNIDPPDIKPCTHIIHIANSHSQHHKWSKDHKQNIYCQSCISEVILVPSVHLSVIHLTRLFVTTLMAE